MAAVPRQWFIPDTVWRPEDRQLVPLRRAEDPRGWLALAAGERPVITQVIGGRITSSASMPKLVADMLDQLDPRVGHRVLEIGTGTGWNAALLAHLLGAEHVTSIEIDPDIAARARQALADHGYGKVTAVVGDGALGYPPGAPYDRLIATAAARRVPYPWVAQTRPGGRIVLPWDLDYLGLLVSLTVTEDGTAAGYAFDHANFMLLRGQRSGTSGFSSTDEEEQAADRIETDLRPRDVADPYDSLDAVVTIAVRVPHCRMAYYPPTGAGRDAGILWLADHDSGSWARLHHPPGGHGPRPVYQYGPRRLWNEVEAAHSWWVAHDRPAVDRWRFTVTPQGRQIELSRPRE
jgi:protein-L-isoaspartate(D-aspartate) O-methyltransferase